jgi:hypothetical protein
LAWSTMQILLVGEQCGGGTQRSPPLVRDQGESNLILWPLFLPFSPCLLSFHLLLALTLPLPHLVFHYFSAAGCLRSRGGCQMTRWFRDRGRCQIELTLLDVFLVHIVFLDAFDFGCFLISFPLKHYRWMWRFWTKPWRHLLPHCNIFFSFRSKDVV